MEDLPDNSDCEEEDDELDEDEDEEPCDEECECDECNPQAVLLRIFYTKISLTHNTETGLVEALQTTDPDEASYKIQSAWRRFYNQKKESEAAKKIQSVWRMKKVKNKVRTE